jgi:hypothetical protein
MEETMRIRQMTAAALIASALALGTGGAAQASTYGGGDSSTAPGQENAVENCTNTIDSQTEDGVTAGGGSKEGTPAPANCDHYFQIK